jgi:hypothetical protein
VREFAHCNVADISVRNIRHYTLAGDIASLTAGDRAPRPTNPQYTHRWLRRRWPYAIAMGVTSTRTHCVRLVPSWRVETVSDNTRKVEFIPRDLCRCVSSGATPSSRGASGEPVSRSVAAEARATDLALDLALVFET